MPSDETIAVIDIGSNSIKLLVATAENNSASVTTLFAETMETRISTGISQAEPVLQSDAITKGARAVEELYKLALGYQPARIAIVATSAVRDAKNGADFIDAVEKRTGIRLRTLTGVEEANYIGKGLASDPALEDLEDFLQMDIGGGSLELIRFESGEIKQAISLQLGAVRLTERFIADREAPINYETENTIQSHVRNALGNSTFELPIDPSPMVATGGAFAISRAMLAAEVGRTIQEREPLIQLAEISRLKKKLLRLPMHERMAVPHLPAARADIIPVALITIEEVLRFCGRNAVSHSFYNLRYGIASELLFQV